MAGVELRGLGKVFPNGVAAVAGVDLHVDEGVFLAVVGPSGSGKSTLLRLIAGLETPSAGSVSIGGQDVTDRVPRDRNVAMVFQDPALFPYLSVFDNLAFGLRARGTERRVVKERVESVARQFDLAGLLDRRPATLSGGQRQRVALGRAVVRQPAAFLFDEPLSSLDAPLRASIRTDLLALHRRLAATTIYVTHDQAEALSMGDRVAVMDRGRVVQVGAPRDVYEHPATQFVASFVGNPPMPMVRCRVVPGDGPMEVQLGAIKLPLPSGDGPWTGPLAARRGTGVDLGLRPEHVALARSPDARDPSFTWLPEPAEVIQVDFLGHESIAVLGPPAGSILTRIPGALNVSPGDAFFVGLDLERASWFDPETGTALGPGPAGRPAGP